MLDLYGNTRLSTTGSCYDIIGTSFEGPSLDVEQTRGWLLKTQIFPFINFENPLYFWVGKGALEAPSNDTLEA